MMGANIELWKYRKFANNSLLLEVVYQKSKVSSVSSSNSTGKNPVMVEAGKKAAITRATGEYTFEQHVNGKSQKICDLIESIREFILNLDDSIEEVPKKLYIAYKASQNIACVSPHTNNIKLFLKLNPGDFTENTNNIKYYKDVTNIGHWGTGNSQFTISNQEEFEDIKKYIELAYNKIGG